MHVRRHACLWVRCEAWRWNSYYHLNLTLMDNYIKGMFITVQIAENCRSSSPPVKTTMSDDRCAYLPKTKWVQTFNKPAWWFNLHSCFTDKQWLKNYPGCFEQSLIGALFSLHHRKNWEGERIKLKVKNKCASFNAFWCIFKWKRWKIQFRVNKMWREETIHLHPLLIPGHPIAFNWVLKFVRAPPGLWARTKSSLMHNRHLGIHSL